MTELILKLTLLTKSLHFFSLQIVFADIIHNKIFVTEDQGVSFTRRLLKFTPDKITFQSRDAPMSDDNHLSKHILGYDNDRQQVT